MLRCNLSVLLAERNLKITKVCNDTGISRTTLTYLVNNYSKGIQYDTLNTLCTYLHVSPGEMFLFVPIDINILDIHYIPGTDFRMSLEIIQKNITKMCTLNGEVQLSYATKADPFYDEYKDVSDIPYGFELRISSPNDNFVTDAFKALPIQFFNNIEKTIADAVGDILEKKYPLNKLHEPFIQTVLWDDSFYA